MRSVIANSEETACKKVLRREMIEKYPILNYFSPQWFNQKLRVGRDNKKRYSKAQVKESKINNEESSDSLFALQNPNFFCKIMP
jgi:hypothetical protein